MIGDLATEVHSPDRLLAKVYIEGQPQPGQSIELNGQTYTVLERRHQYHLRWGKYHLYRVILWVQLLGHQEQSLWEGKWIIGNPDCKYNARSELFRCAVNPGGPCLGCIHFEPRI